jgi:hypothetical protein
MKIGDLVRWGGSPDLNTTRRDTGIVVDGPREGTRGDEPAISYEVVWFDCKETFWHNDYNLELISEYR